MSDLLTLAAAGYGAAGEATYVEDVFSTYLYTGNGGTAVSGTQTQNIENGIALSDANSGGSVYFDGSGDYLAVADADNLDFGSSDFTVECWIYTGSPSTTAIFFNKRANKSTFAGVYMGLAGGDIVAGATSNGSSWDIIPTNTSFGTLNANTWHHVAVVRNGNTFTGYLDGVGTTLATSSATILANSTPVHLGGDTNGFYFNGYISNARLVKGTAVYTSAFIPPTAPLTAISGTSLLTCQGTTIEDASSNAHTITVNGDAEAKAFGPFTSDTAGKGGLTWIKRRNTAVGHYLFDTERGADSWISSESSNAETTVAGVLNSFNANGFSVGDSNGTNANGGTYASWTFAKQEKFFDVVTYTGNGSGGRTITHNLGSAPGTIIFKSTSNTQDWYVYHRSIGATGFLLLNGTNAVTSSANFMYNTEPTSTEFTLGGGYANTSGYEYVAYLFAHNDGDGIFGENGDQDIIKCGSFSTNASGDADIDIGFEPQWVLVKPTSTTLNWYLWDNMRGMVVGGADAPLFPNTSGAEISADNIQPNATGFHIDALTNQNWIYIAIRRGPMKTPTSGTEVLHIEPYTGTITAGQEVPSPFPPDISLSAQLGTSQNKFWTPRTSETYYYGNSKNTGFWFFDGEAGQVYMAADRAFDPIHYLFRRSPKFLDIVSWSGTANVKTVPHNLGVAPEFMMIFTRVGSTGSHLYSSGVGADQRTSYGTTTGAVTDTTYLNSTAPTATEITIGNSTVTNVSGNEYEAFLFASLEGVSKVGTFAHFNGTPTNVDCGFSNGARMVIWRRYNVADETVLMESNTLGIVAGSESYLNIRYAQAPQTGDIIDPLSSGFTVDSNVLTGTYMYLAIA